MLKASQALETIPRLLRNAEISSFFKVFRFFLKYLELGFSKFRSLADYSSNPWFVLV